MAARQPSAGGTVSSSQPNSARRTPRLTGNESSRSIGSNGSQTSNGNGNAGESKRTSTAVPASVPKHTPAIPSSPPPPSSSSSSAVASSNNNEWPVIRYGRTRVPFPLKRLSSSLPDTCSLPSSSPSPSSSSSLPSRLLSRHRFVGYNGRARHNAIWHADTALLTYSSGQLVIIENLQPEPNQPNQAVLEGHDDDITTMAVSSTGRYIASASGRATYTHDSHDEKKATSGQIRVWDTSTHACVANLLANAHGLRHSYTGGYQRICFHPMRPLLATICNHTANDTTTSLITIWNWERRTAAAHIELSYAVFDAHWLSDDVQIHDTSAATTTHGKEPSVSQLMVCGRGALTRLSFHLTESASYTIDQVQLPSPDDDTDFTAFDFAFDIGGRSRPLIVLGTSAGDVYVLTLAGVILFGAPAMQHEITTLHCLADGRIIATTATGLIRVWHITPAPDDAARVRIIGDHDTRSVQVDSAIISSSWHMYGDVGIVATISGTIWHVTTLSQQILQKHHDRIAADVHDAAGEPIRLVGGHTHFINQLVCHPTKTIVASASSDGSLRLWKVANEQLLQVMQFQAKNQLCLCVAFHPTADLCALGYDSGQVRILDVASQRQLSTINMPGEAESITALTYNRRGTIIICGTSCGSIFFLSPSTNRMVRWNEEYLRGKQVAGPAHANSRIDTIAISPHDPSIWMATDSAGRLSVWHTKWDQIAFTSIAAESSSAPLLIHHTHRYVDISAAYAHRYQPIRSSSSSSDGTTDDASLSSFVPATLAVWSPHDPHLIICAAPAGIATDGRASLSTSRASSYGVMIYDWQRDVFVRHIPTSSVPTSLDISPHARFLAVGQQGREVSVFDMNQIDLSPSSSSSTTSSNSTPITAMATWTCHCDLVNSVTWAPWAAPGLLLTASVAQIAAFGLHGNDDVTIAPVAVVTPRPLTSSSKSATPRRHHATATPASAASSSSYASPNRERRSTPSLPISPLRW